MTTLQDVELSLGEMEPRIKQADRAELVLMLYTLMDRRLDFLEQIYTHRYVGTPSQVATLRSWDTFDLMIWERMKHV